MNNIQKLFKKTRETKTHIQMKTSFNVASFTSKQAPSALIQNNGEFQAVLLSFSFLVFPVL